jgi:ectoine hydroxylase
MASGPITVDQLAEYRKKGYTLVRRMFNSQEIDLLGHSAKQDKTLDDHAFGRDDGRGKIVRLSLWNQPGDTIYGMFARCESIVNSAERILEGEVYHYHSKMIMKDAKTGGAWAWHQDYGYWYQNGVLAPDLCSAFMAVDPATAKMAAFR